MRKTEGGGQVRLEHLGKARRAIRLHVSLTLGERNMERIMDGHFLDCPVI